MKSCIGTTREVMNMVEQAVLGGFITEVDHTAGTVIIQNTHREDIYRAMQMGVGAKTWVVRYDPNFFGGKDEDESGPTDHDVP